MDNSSEFDNDPILKSVKEMKCKEKKKPVEDLIKEKFNCVNHVIIPTHLPHVSENLSVLAKQCNEIAEKLDHLKRKELAFLISLKCMSNVYLHRAHRIILIFISCAKNILNYLLLT
jgi:hypothetical protein